MTRNVSADPVSPFNAAFQALIVTDALSNLIQTSWYGNEYQGGATNAGMPFNQVSGSAPMKTMTYGIWSGESDPGPVPYGPGIAIEAWPFGSTNSPGAASHDNAVNGTVTVTHGGPNVVGSGTNFTVMLEPGDQVCFGIAATAIFYTVLSIGSDTALVLTGNYNETSAGGIEIYGPFNRPPTLAQWEAVGVMPLDDSGGDSRIVALQRNESTGSPATLFEDFLPYSQDGGATWNAIGGGCKWDLTTGAQRPDGWTSTTAGGTPTLPFLVRYEEAASGVITHPLRGIIASALGLTNMCVWPGLHSAAAFAGADWTAGGLPTGARLRLNADWLAANLSSFSAINQAILTAAHQYGLHVNDYTGGRPVWIDGAPDSRWDKADVLALWEHSRHGVRGD